MDHHLMINSMDFILWTPYSLYYGHRLWSLDRHFVDSEHLPRFLKALDELMETSENCLLTMSKDFKRNSVNCWTNAISDAVLSGSGCCSNIKDRWWAIPSVGWWRHLESEFWIQNFKELTKRIKFLKLKLLETLLQTGSSSRAICF